MQGKIMAYAYSRGSGIMQLIIQVEGRDKIIPCDAGATFRALLLAFGSVQEAIGKTIEYTMTDYGTMESFEPVEMEG